MSIHDFLRENGLRSIVVESPHVLHTAASGKIEHYEELIKSLEGRLKDVKDDHSREVIEDSIKKAEHALKLWEDEKDHAERHPDHPEGEYPH
jgi:hypothetical protein